jgi:hypothetical protein
MKTHVFIPVIPTVVAMRQQHCGGKKSHEYHSRLILSVYLCLAQGLPG